MASENYDFLFFSKANGYVFSQIQNTFIKIMVVVERLLQLLLFAEMQLALRYLLIQFMLQKMLIQDGVNKGQLVHNLPLYQKYEIIFLSKHKKGPRLGSKKVAFLIHCDTKTVRY
jgi:hypothetical protein